MAIDPDPDDYQALGEKVAADVRATVAEYLKPGTVHSAESIAVVIAGVATVFIEVVATSRRDGISTRDAAVFLLDSVIEGNPETMIKLAENREMGRAN